VVSEAVEVLSHSDVRWWLARCGSLSGGSDEAVEVLTEETFVLVT